MDTPVAGPRSCHVLEFSVQPGGARLGDVNVYGTLADLEFGENEYLAGS